jgi:hypothetical protein
MTNKKSSFFLSDEERKQLNTNWRLVDKVTLAASIILAVASVAIIIWSK